MVITYLILNMAHLGVLHPRWLVVGPKRSVTRERSTESVGLGDRWVWPVDCGLLGSDFYKHVFGSLNKSNLLSVSHWGIISSKIILVGSTKLALTSDVVFIPPDGVIE